MLRGVSTAGRADIVLRVISSVAFCPQAPVLLPDVGRGTATELDGLRAACQQAIAAAGAVSAGRQLVLLGSGGVSRRYPAGARASTTGFGVPTSPSTAPPAAGELPAALAVGSLLVRDAVGATGQADAAIAFCAGPEFATSTAARELRALADSRDVALVVLGDGSACRTLKAPGYLDDRAAAYDGAIAAALHGGDGSALTGLDAGLGAELLAAGVPAWHAAGTLLAGTRYRAELLYEGAPFGVGYFVAAWRTDA